MVVLVVSGLLSAPALSDCGFLALLGSGCPAVDAETDGREVELRGELTFPGAGAGRGNSAGEGGGGGEDEDPVAPVAMWRPVDPSRPFIAPRPFPNIEFDVDGGLPDLTLQDFESFVPVAGRQIGEPAGWGIVGLETNFYAESRAHVVDGDLLGLPASVRFTPVAWHWSYGDGVTVSTRTPGGPWGSAAAEFEPTATSHRYTAPGAYLVNLTVEFGAEYRLGRLPWTPLVGTVTAQAEPLTVRIATADTVLVERNCDTGSSLGC
jgi:hypothetical protein